MIHAVNRDSRHRLSLSLQHDIHTFLATLQFEFVLSYIHIIPILTIVDGVVVEQPYEPFACRLVPKAEVEARFHLRLSHYGNKGEEDGGDDCLFHISLFS